MKLSKSKFVAGCQCLRRLYWQVHEPELAATPDAAAEAIIRQGRDVGILARKLFPGGMEVCEGGLDEAIRTTRELVSELALFDKFLAETRYVGEIGLDGSPEFRSQWQSQCQVFEHILKSCSDAGGRIMSIHSRRATSKVLDTLQSFLGAGVPILHWFSGSLRDLDRAVSLGYWFSVGPRMLASEKGRSLLTRMPRERVLTESDGPFAQVDGRSLMPWNVDYAVGALAQVWDLSDAAAQQLIHDNFRTLCSQPVASDKETCDLLSVSRMAEKSH